MAKRQQYDETAREFVYGFYARGYARDKALPEIRKVYSGFAARTWDRWVEEHSWRERRALADAKIARFEEFAANAWIELLMDLDVARRRLRESIDSQKEIDPQTVYAFTSVSAQIVNLVAKHGGSKDPQKVAMETIALAVEAMVNEMKAVEGLGPALKRRAQEVGRIAKKIAEQFGRN
ncbi:MAG: hypothetical protein KDC27_11870 [Acidobacteria bacterium]|nr:hypothetical protein [Acidobacteriota bacterium]